MTIRDKTLSACSALTLTALGLLVVPVTAHAAPVFPLAPACNAWTLQSPVLVIDVGGSPNFIQLDWSGTRPGPGAKSIVKATGNDFLSGTASGPGLTNPSGKIDFTINWSNGAGAHFTGALDPEFGSARGTAESEGAKYDWVAHEHFTCTQQAPAPAPPPPPPPPPAPAPAQPAAKTATVNQPDDIYSLPDGNGTTFKDADGVTIFKPPGQVQLVGPEFCRNNWCHVVAPEVPPGQGWIYAGEGFVTVP